MDKIKQIPIADEAADDGRALQARLLLIVDSLCATILFNPLVAVFGACVLVSPGSPFGPVAPARLAAALLLMIGCSALAWTAHRAYREIPLDNLARIERNLILLQVLFSSAWGAIAFFYWVPGNPVNQVYVSMIMGIVAFSAVFARSMHTPMFVTAVLVQGGIYLTRLATGDTLVAHILAVTSLGYLGYVLTMGIGSRKRVDALIRARFENEDMAVKLARTRDEALKKRYEAETANASKTAFLANMSHELRTPLNAILGFSDIIANQSMGDDQIDRYSDYARDIHGSGVHLLSLINDLLDVAKIESGKMEIDPTTIDPRDVVENASRLVAPKIAAKGQALNIVIGPDTPWVVADERAFKQMLLNLLSNAVKFTPEGGHITITCNRAPKTGLLVSVEDDGPGIPVEKLARMFQPFSQIDNRYDRKAGGTGLGLALVRGLVQLHRGRVWIESSTGAGVKAFLYFPSTIERVADADLRLKNSA